MDLHILYTKIQFIILKKYLYRFYIKRLQIEIFLGYIFNIFND